MGTGVFRGGSGVSVEASSGVGVGTASGVGVAAGATVGGAEVCPSDSESPHATIATTKAHIRKKDTVQAKLRLLNPMLVNQLTYD